MHKSSTKLMVFVAPFLLAATLQVAGCVRRELPPPPPGGAYISTSGGAQFDQAPNIINENGEVVAHNSELSLLQIHRPPHKSGTTYLIAGSAGVLVSSNDGKTWKTLNQPLTLATAFVELANDVMLVSGSNEENDGVVMRSLDRGKSWHKVLTIPATKKAPSKLFEIIKPPAPPPVFVSSLAIDPFQGDQVYATTSTGEIVVGSESGKLWKKISTLTGKINALTNRADAPVKAIIPSPHVKNEILVITTEGKLVRVQNTDEPETEDFKRSEELKSLGTQTVIDVVFAKGLPDTILASTKRGAVVSTDRGETWEQLGLPISQAAPLVNAIPRVSPTNNNRIIISADSVVFRSEDGGQTWNTLSLDLPNHVITDISINPENASKVLLITTPHKT